MRPSRVLLVWVAIGLGVGGCSVVPSTAAPVGAAVSAPTDAQRAQWALPLDPYIMGPIDSEIANYVENRLVRTCMEAKSLDWPIPSLDVTTLKSIGMSPSGRTLLTMEAATTVGYHPASMFPQEYRAQMRVLNGQQLTANKQAAIDECLTSIRAETMPMPEFEQFGSSLANEAMTQAMSQDEVTAAAATWRQCMAPQGISDLPTAPEGQDEGMPTPSQSAEFGLADPQSVAGPLEIAAAVADVTCRESSGYNDAMYLAEWEAQSRLLTENADRLVREKAAIDTYVAKSKALLTTIAGT